MQPVIGVVGAGAMGAGIARRLTENGARVLTLLEGRSPATHARAAAAGMEATDLPRLAQAETILSILPPAEAMRFAQTLARHVETHKPTFVDCNALDVATVQAVADAIPTQFVDAGIIGLPPEPGEPGPILYLAGPQAPAIEALLTHHGLRAKAMQGPIGAASALKMSYAGITKGITAIATLMILGAERAGAGEALKAELASSQPALLKRFANSLPGMVPKAYRWVAEMHEIAAFLGNDPAGTAVFEGIAQLYERIAADAQGERREVKVIEEFARQDLGEPTDVLS